MNSDITLHKTMLNGHPIVYLKGNVFPFKDIIKNPKYGAKWNNPNKFWFWFLDKNDPQKTIDSIVKPALTEVKQIQNLTLEIDEIIAAITEENPAANHIITTNQQTEIKKKLEEFKTMLINIEDDAQFKELMSKIIQIKSVQGQKFSLGNSLLIFIQNMNAGIVNSRTNWLTFYNREVNNNATPLMVWAPQGSKFAKSSDEKAKIEAEFYKKINKSKGDTLTPAEGIKLKELSRDMVYASKFNLVPVYSQHDTTQIKDTEDLVAKAQKTRKEIKWFEDEMLSEEIRPIYDGLIDFAKTNNIHVELIDDLGGSRGVSMSGKIQILKNEGNDVGLTKTLAHEITHELLHQKYLKTKGGDSGKYHLGKNMGKETIEQQAELSAWMFMHAFGFDVKTTSLNYTVLWGGDKDNMVKVFDTVSSVVNYLINEVSDRIKNLTENAISNPKHISPEEIAKLTGFAKEYEIIKNKQELHESLRKKLNLI